MGGSAIGTNYNAAFTGGQIDDLKPPHKENYHLAKLRIKVHV